MKEEKQKFWSFLGTVMIVSVLTASLAGIIAAVVTNQSLDRYFEYLSNGEQRVSISEVKPRPLPGTYEEALSRVHEVGWPSTAVIRTQTKDSQLASEWIGLESAAGFGAVVTNDGWILFHQATLDQFSDPVELAEIWVNEQRYQIEQIVEDDLTDYVLVKIEARDLSALAFGASAEARSGEMVFQLSGPYAVQAMSIDDTEVLIDDYIKPDVAFIAQWQLSEATDVIGPILNSAGELVGFTSGDGAALPRHHGIAFVQSVLRNSEAEHAAMGVYTVDLDSVLNIDPELTDNVTAGAYLMAPKNRRSAIVQNSPAAEVGLQDGDIIVAIDDILIFGSTSLAEILSNYKVDDQAMLTISRAGETQEIQITFANYADLVY